MRSFMILAAFGAGLCALLAPSLATAQDTPAAEQGFGDWVLRCRAGRAEGEAAAAETCEITQEFKQAETGQRVIALGLRAQDQDAMLTIVAPLGVTLSQGLTLEADGEALLALPFARCVPQGCITFGPLKAEDITRMAKSEALAAVMAVSAADGAQQALSITLSGNGLGDAWQALQEQQPAAE